MNDSPAHPTHRTPRRSWGRGALGVLVAGALAATTMTASVAAAPAPPTTDPTTAAAYGASWLAGEVTAGGFVPDGNGDPSAGRTVSTALAFASAGVEADAFGRSVAWLTDHVDDYVVVDGSDSPGALGYLLVLVDAAGLDPTSFGGTNLVTRLQATLGAFEPGLYGSADPTYDGASRQGLAIIGLEAAGVTPSPEAITWLTDQQCGAVPASAAGGWQAYRADTGQPCVAPDPEFFVGPDTNSTAFAIEGLSAAEAPIGSALDYLHAAQGADGGWGFMPGGEIDTNSSALVIQALLSAGQDPASSVWSAEGGTPYGSLLSWQIGCDAPSGDVGAFASPFSDGAPDDYATQQAVWGASGNTWPLGPVDFEAAPLPCEVPSPTPTTSSPTTAAPPTTAANPTVQAGAEAVSISPHFTG